MPEYRGQPSVGQVVHYVSHDTRGGVILHECRAAVITETDHRDASVGLFVMTPSGQFFDRGVYFDGGDEKTSVLTHMCGARTYPGSTWHWPART